MSDARGQHSWTDDRTGEVDEVDEVEERIAPLRSASFVGLGLGVLLLTVGTALLQDADTSASGLPRGSVLCFALAFGALGWGGLAALAFWVCRAFLGR
ncbi:hypothetical protein [Kineococcus sp. SYSU DK005]|uniref:hypothetical protein n=1 Tax=Kineococcus sp. SYSU DK005 TaxID=3383126 RepID=UPI003D7C5A95